MDSHIFNFLPLISLLIVGWYHFFLIITSVKSWCQFLNHFFSWKNSAIYFSILMTIQMEWWHCSICWLWEIGKCGCRYHLCVTISLYTFISLFHDCRYVVVHDHGYADHIFLWQCTFRLFSSRVGRNLIYYTFLFILLIWLHEFPIFLARLWQ